MKNIVITLFLSIILAACGSEPNDLKDPNIVAEKFLKAYISMDYDAAKKYATPDFITLLDQYAAEKELLAPDVVKEAQQATVEIKNVDVKDAEGMALVKFSQSQLADIVDQLELKKIDGNWYAHNVERTVDMELDNKFSDEDIEKMMEEAEAQDETIPVEVIE